MLTLDKNIVLSKILCCVWFENIQLYNLNNSSKKSLQIKDVYNLFLSPNIANCLADTFHNTSLNLHVYTCESHEHFREWFVEEKFTLIILMQNQAEKSNIKMMIIYLHI